MTLQSFVYRACVLTLITTSTVIAFSNFASATANAGAPDPQIYVPSSQQNALDTFTQGLTLNGTCAQRMNELAGRMAYAFRDLALNEVSVNQHIPIQTYSFNYGIHSRRADRNDSHGTWVVVWVNFDLTSSQGTPLSVVPYVNGDVNNTIKGLPLGFYDQDNTVRDAEMNAVGSQPTCTVRSHLDDTTLWNTRSNQPFRGVFQQSYFTHYH